MKKHRHKWVDGFADCPFCGGGYYQECECGAVREPKKRPKGL